MLGTYSATPALPWPAALPHRRARPVARASVAGQALRHGMRSAIQATCLSAAVMAATGVLGAARGPVVLSQPQPATVHVVVAPPAFPVQGVAGTPRTR